MLQQPQCATAPSVSSPGELADLVVLDDDALAQVTGGVALFGPGGSWSDLSGGPGNNW